MPDRRNEYTRTTTTNTRRTQSQKEQKFFCDLAAALADGKITPEQACSMIEAAHDANIFVDDILEPENPEQEKQKGFNEIAGSLFRLPNPEGRSV